MIFLFPTICIISILCFCIVTFCWLSRTVTVNFLSFGGNFWNINLDFNSITLLILLMLLICFLYVCGYTQHYFGGDSSSENLSKVVCLFVAVMASLVCTGDFVLTLVFWEYLGVVSFFLILFYGSYLSLRSSIVTLVSSRFGDVSLFILVCMCSYSINNMVPALAVFFFIIFTKSAGFPFISWLLEAMRAPTPVSSLVHSSTLVAAGVWFVMRYDYLLYFSSSYVFVLLLLLTIFITGLSSFYFIDLKKIVALSTCNNISWCVLYLIFGDFTLSLFQLVSHGVSKCILFMLVGDVMSGTSGSQGSNCVYGSSLYSNWSSFSLFSVILGLSGAPFIGVFFTKHFLLTTLSSIENFSLYVFVMMCVFLSYFYSFRLCTILVNIKSSVATGVLYFFNSGLMGYAWLFINYFIALTLDEKSCLSVYNSINLIIFQVIACVTAYFFYSNTLVSNWSSSLFGCDNLVELAYTFFSNTYNIAIAFFYRWDSYVLGLFFNIGNSALNVYTNNFLNILIITIFFILMCCCIL